MSRIGCPDGVVVDVLFTIMMMMILYNDDDGDDSYVY
jgi:hypothetical protein